MSRGFFIAGTDTGVGKTRATAALCRTFRATGLRVAAMKPVASGAERLEGGLRSADALSLIAAASVAVPYELVNPYCFEPAVSPHLAAREVGLSIDPARIAGCYAQLAKRAEVVLVEGSGGWLTPIGAAATMADIAAALALPVVLVVGLRLGCLNHAALTFQAVRDARASFAGWIANAIDPRFERPDENVATLAAIFAAPPLGALEYASSTDTDPARLADAAASLLQAEVEPAARGRAIVSD